MSRTDIVPIDELVESIDELVDGAKSHRARAAAKELATLPYDAVDVGLRAAMRAYATEGQTLRNLQRLKKLIGMFRRKFNDFSPLEADIAPGLRLPVDEEEGGDTNFIYVPFRAASGGRLIKPDLIAHLQSEGIAVDPLTGHALDFERVKEIESLQAFAQTHTIDANYVAVPRQNIDVGKDVIRRLNKCARKIISSGGQECIGHVLPADMACHLATDIRDALRQQNKYASAMFDFTLAEWIRSMQEQISQTYRGVVAGKLYFVATVARLAQQQHAFLRDCAKLEALWHLATEKVYLAQEMVQEYASEEMDEVPYYEAAAALRQAVAETARVAGPVSDDNGARELVDQLVEITVRDDMARWLAMRAEGAVDQEEVARGLDVLANVVLPQLAPLRAAHSLRL